MRLSTVDLHVPTGLNQLLFIEKIFFTFFTKQAILMRGSTVLNLPLQLAVHGWTIDCVRTTFAYIVEWIKSRRAKEYLKFGMLQVL